MSMKKIAALASASVLIAGIGTVATQTAARAQAPFPHPMIRHHERHPELMRAMRQLENARASLQSAAHDYHGHRDQAVALINQAIDQIHQAIQSDRY